MVFIQAMSTHHAAILRGGPSINKAMRLIEHLQDGELLPKNITYHRAAWNEYRTTAHLCAAYVYMTQPIINDFHAGKLAPKTVFRELQGAMWHAFDVFLAAAHCFQQFGLAFRLSRTRDIEALLPAERLWLLPHAAQWEPLETKVTPLPADLVALLMQKAATH
ncbi:MAG: hypothetical protein H0V62_12585 [Gammaproteobacteria bacterium]|nr:hypothetical protein [Gammaproteobacteria bacterium]